MTPPAGIPRATRRAPPAEDAVWCRRGPLPLVIGIALAVRLLHIVALGDYIGADEAVVGIMATKIAEFEAAPIYMWGAHYGGTLTSYLAAPLFMILPPSPWLLRVASVPLALVGIAAVTGAASRLAGPVAGLAAGVWLAAGPPLVFAMTGQVIGGYPEVLCFGGLALRLGVGLVRESAHERQWFWLGLVGGLGTYSLPLALPVFAGVVLAIRHAMRPAGGSFWLLAAGFLLGVMPAIAYNVLHDGASLTRLAGRVLDVSRAEVAHGAGLASLALAKGARYIAELARFPLSLIGNVPAWLGLPWWLAWPAAAVVAGHAVAPGLGRRLVSIAGLLTLLFVWALRLDAARHLMPFYPLAALAVGLTVARLAGRVRAAALAAVVLVAAVNVGHVVTEARQAAPRAARLVSALRSHAVDAVYTDYFIAYPVLFLSRESVAVSPAAGPVNVDRYPSSSGRVDRAPRPAYVFEAATPASARFARELARLDVAAVHERIGEWDLYRPARAVRPEGLGLMLAFPR